ncbi:glycosyltransferase [Planctomicrobium sp. SH668]|uniref:glycosyltransferase n=1 Tax=Planctomicrobium sp. SH668 TaxID=3448126 RepID=UPI003F5C6333
MNRLALVFEDGCRPETTGTYCVRALLSLATGSGLTGVEHVRPNQLGQFDFSCFDAVIAVDDGLDYDLPQCDAIKVWWAIDTHLSFERCLHKARQADLVFAAQKNGAEELVRAGISSAQWLPLACDPEIHGRCEAPNRFDIGFVGHSFPGEREERLALIQRRFPRSFVGTADYREMATIYSAAHLVFNCSLRDDINMRVFEGLCSGSLLLTNDLTDNGQELLFQAGEHFASYRTRGELLERIDYYLEHPLERERIAAAGREHVLSHHTYRHRVEVILASINTLQMQRLSQRSKTATEFSFPEKSRGYFEFDRPDVLELVPSTSQRVLDVGCGGGRLGAAIKARQAAEVVGIELNPLAIDSACQRLDEVIVGDIQTGAIEFPDGTFDCVICADVLEHLRDPLAVLRRLRRWLSPGGVLITSLPNVRNQKVIRSLLAGNWTYESAGLLDEDHVRFFTRREIEKLLFRAGFQPQEQRMVPGEGFAEWVEKGSPPELEIGQFRLRLNSAAEAAEFLAYQYLTRSVPVHQNKAGLTSIVIVTLNNWHLTHACLESIRLRTDLPFELIVVDNGSTDGTVSFLQSSPDVTLIQNDTNRGFPAAANQGIAVAKGDHVLLLNNDTLVTTGWLENLLAGLTSHPEIGLVGPVSNNVSGPQQVEVSYEDETQLDGFAWDWGQQHRGQLVPTERLVGFCLLIKREVIDRVGLLDERFGLGNFEDDDYCRRAAQEGFRCAIVPNAFIHHVGSATFRATGVNFRSLLQENESKFNEKWREHSIDPITDADIDGSVAEDAPQDAVSQTASPELRDEPLPLGSPVRPKFLFDVTDGGELLLKPNNVKLSACLIVRDNARTIRPCLDSLLPWMDEIVVVDTGSLDATPLICEELGARVLHSPWQDSFSQARNVSLSYARGEWIFWMDSDDTLPEECGRQLRALVEGLHPDNVQGYIVQVHCPGVTEHDVTVVDHVKLIRNRPELRFEFHIHEQILPSIRRVNGDVAWTDLYVVHSGSDKTPEGRARKLERDYRLLKLDLDARPDHPFVLFNLGMTYADDQQHQPAIHYLRRCLEVSGSEESHVRKAYALLIGVLMQAGQIEEASHICQTGLKHYPDDKELLFRQAMLQHATGQLQAAAETYQHLIHHQSDRHFTSVDQGLAGHKARHNLAIVYEDLGRFDQSLEQWNAILNDYPDYEPALQATRRLQSMPSQEVQG